MPTLEEYIAASEQYSQEQLALIPEDLRSQINSQLEAAADGQQVDAQ